MFNRLLLLLFFFILVAAVTCSVVNYNGTSIKEVAKNLTLGEGPFWDSENNVLYFVDIYQYRVYRYFQNRLEHVQLGIREIFLKTFPHFALTDREKFIVTDDNVGFVIPIAGEQGLFVIGLGTTLTSLRWNLNETTSKVVRLTTVDKDKPDNRWNDAKADNNGYLWAGELFIFERTEIVSLQWQFGRHDGTREHQRNLPIESRNTVYVKRYQLFPEARARCIKCFHF